jgi:hypothetical protein
MQISDKEQQGLALPLVAIAEAAKKEASESRESHLAALRRLMPAIFARYKIAWQWERAFDALVGSSDETVANAHRCYAALARSVRSQTEQPHGLGEGEAMTEQTSDKQVRLNVAQGLDDFARHDGNADHRDRKNLLYKAADLLRTEPPSPAAQAGPEVLCPLLEANEAVMDKFVAEYEWDAGEDGYHNPTDKERILIGDAIAGLHADDNFVRTFNAWQDALRGHRPPTPASGETPPNKRPWSDNLAGEVIAGQVKEIDRLTKLVQQERAAAPQPKEPSRQHLELGADAAPRSQTLPPLRPLPSARRR